MYCHLEGGGQLVEDMVAYGKKPTSLYAGFQMNHQDSFWELLFEVVALYISIPQIVLSFNFCFLFDDQPEWSKVQPINQGLQIEAE